MAPPSDTIIIKKKKKSAEDAHHGGAWKIAYADFVTAMMAFFLLMWLLNATSEDQKLGIANYFNPTIGLSEGAGSTGILEGTTPIPLQGGQDTSGMDAEDDGHLDGPAEMELEDAEELVRERENEQFAEIKAEVLKEIESVPELSKLAKHLLIDQTQEGLRIQLIDRDQASSMFASGSALPLAHTRQLLRVVARAINGVSQRISVKGHTDAVPYTANLTYDNWDLSTARANAARRVLEESGVKSSRFASVVGHADVDPLIPDSPSDPRNRRISIVLMRDLPPGQPGDG